MVPKTKAELHTLDGEPCNNESEAWMYFNDFEDLLTKYSPQISVEQSVDKEGGVTYTPTITWGSVRPTITQEL